MSKSPHRISQEFIELPGAEKRQLLAAGVIRKYERVGSARKPSAELEKTLRYWHDRRALEIKYKNHNMLERVIWSHSAWGELLTRIVVRSRIEQRVAPAAVIAIVGLRPPGIELGIHVLRLPAGRQLAHEVEQ